MLNKIKAVWKQRGHVIIAVGIALLFSLGGGGMKELRRYALPILVAFSIPSPYYKKAIFVIYTMIVLSLGYTPIMDGEQYIKLIGLSALYSLGFLIYKISLKYLITLLTFITIIPLALFCNKHLNLSWEYFELACGSCFAIGYLQYRNLEVVQ